MSVSQKSSYRFRPFTPADLTAAYALSTQLKWPHRLEDWAMLDRVAEGFVAEDGERLIGTAFTCPQGAYATIGLVIVSDDYQGQGIGRKLMDMALESSSPRTAILNATLAGVPLYSSQGFVEFGQVQQHQGQAQAASLPPLPANERCRQLTIADRRRQLELANAGSGLDRASVLNDLFGAIEHAIGIERDGQLCAFAIQRAFGRGHCIGPIIAENPRQAQHLIAALVAQVPNEFVRVDVPADCGLSDWLETAGLKQVDKVAQMARGTPPQSVGGFKQFALVSQAIG